MLSVESADYVWCLIDSPDSCDPVGSDMFTLLAICSGAWYITPFVVAYIRQHHQILAILALNVLLGWTLLGWVAAFVWACTVVRQPEEFG